MDEYISRYKGSQIDDAVGRISDLEKELPFKQNKIEDLDDLRSKANAGYSAKETIDTYGDIVTHNATEFITKQTASEVYETKKDFQAELDRKVDKREGYSLVEDTTLSNIISDIASKQDKLIGGNNIKTINGENILGEGDLHLSNYRPDLFEFKWADHKLNNPSWLRSDTFSWQYGDMYIAAYDKLLEEWTNAPRWKEQGTPTIENNILSNLTEDNYVYSDCNFALSGDKQFDMALDVEITKAIESNQTLVSFKTSGVSSGITLILSPSKVTLTYLDSGSLEGSTFVLGISKECTLSVGDKVSFKCTHIVNNTTQGIMRLDVIVNGTSLGVVEKNTTSGTRPFTSFNITEVSLGAHWGTIAPSMSRFPFTSGSIDLSSFSMLWDNQKSELPPIMTTEGNISFCVSENGFKIALVDQEQAILDKYNTDGIAWYYILDTTNKRFKLPRTKFGFEGIRNVVGNDIAESLPNIKGPIQDTFSGVQSSYPTYGPIRVTRTSDRNYSSASGSDNGWTKGTFDASLSSSTYQDNAPVQERATQMYLYFYVGEYTREAIEQTAGLNAEMFNNKQDILYSTKSVDGVQTTIPAIYVKESVVNGTEGHRVWSDGYCEQWGISTENANQQTITLTKTFKDANYNVQITSKNALSGDSGHNIKINSTATNSFILWAEANERPCMWKASGYLADGQY